MKRTIAVARFLSLLAAGVACAAADPGAPAILSAPVFPDHTVTLTDFGAVGDGETDNSAAFVRAIEACVGAGGGHVTVPAGIWRTGPIQFKSRLDLHLETGAVILFSRRFEDYPLLQTTWEGLPRVRCMSPIYGVDLRDIAITGPGVIDGSGGVWRPVKRSKLTDSQWKALVASGGVLNSRQDTWWPNQAALDAPRRIAGLRASDAPLTAYAPLRAFLRPVMVQFVRCKNVLLDGPTFQNSPAWNIHPLLCEDVTVQNITVRNPWYSQNGDGIDIESCRNVLLTNSRFDVGDDAICLKSGKDEYGRRRGRPTENVSITRCTVYHGHGGVTVGSEMSGGVRNVFVDNCSFLGTDVGLRFKSTRGRGGTVEDILIQNIRMTDIATDAIRFNMFYGGRAPVLDEGESEEISSEPPAEPVGPGTPRFQKITLRNILCRGAQRAIWLQGLPELSIQEITLEDLMISARRGATLIDAERIDFSRVNIEAEEGPVLWLFNCRNINAKAMLLPEPATDAYRLSGTKTGNVQVNGQTLR